MYFIFAHLQFKAAKNQQQSMESKHGSGVALIHKREHLSPIDLQDYEG